MLSDLRQHLDTIRIFDTHEHMHKEKTWLDFPTDILQALFHHYITHDLHVAGLAPDDFKRLFPRQAAAPVGPLEERWKILQPVWERCQFTGNGEAVRYAAKTVYGLDEITLDGLRRAEKKLKEFQRPGERLRILRDVAGLDHIQVDDFTFIRQPDSSGPDFFLYDLSWAAFCSGPVPQEEIHKAVGLEVKNLASLKTAMEAIFAKYAPQSVAVKSQHAYGRTLDWTERSDAEAETALAKILKDPKNVDVATSLCLGDWSWSQGARLCAQYNRPFKIHTGYYAGNDRMPLEFVRPGQMYKLLAKHLDTRFVLMHTAYPFGPEIVALCKHYRNVYSDLCWAWSIDPYKTSDFVRSFIHAVPTNKLFAFGGDTFLPTVAVGFARQTRRWLAHTLEQEIKEGWLTEKQAIDLATRFLQTNQQACFDLSATRAGIKTAMAGLAS